MLKENNWISIYMKLPFTITFSKWLPSTSVHILARLPIERLSRIIPLGFSSIPVTGPKMSSSNASYVSTFCWYNKYFLCPDRLLSVEVRRSGWPILWTTKTDPPTRDATIEIRLHPTQSIIWNIQCSLTVGSHTYVCMPFITENDLKLRFYE
jgi:hypothetical protein